jgi:c-di-GMP-binding flagellar brake protein YcgR
VIVTARYKEGNLFFLEILMLGEPAKVQRREFYRYKCSLNAKLRVISDKEYETGVPEDTTLPEELLDWGDAKILDISGGGARLVQKVDLEKNEVVKLKFAVTVLDEVLFFNLFARILGSTVYRGRADLYEQRLEFMKITQENRDKIIRYIFENERMARAKETGLK